MEFDRETVRERMHDRMLAHFNESKEQIASIALDHGSDIEDHWERVINVQAAITMNMLRLAFDCVAVEIEALATVRK